MTTDITKVIGDIIFGLTPDERDRCNQISAESRAQIARCDAASAAVNAAESEAEFQAALEEYAAAFGALRGEVA